MKASTVFVVDDNEDFRRSVAWLLRGEGHLTVEFSCAQKLINMLVNPSTSDLERCCVLLDVRMPGMSGLEVHELIRQKQIALPVVYMTGHADVALAVEAMKMGAFTFLEKPLEPAQLCRAIDDAIASVTSATASTPGPLGQTSDIGEKRRAEFLGACETLTPRERDVLGCIVDGKPNKRIASDLDISVRTVEVHRARLMKKLRVKSAPELVKLVLTCQKNP